MTKKKDGAAPNPAANKDREHFILELMSKYKLTRGEAEDRMAEIETENRIRVEAAVNSLFGEQQAAEFEEWSKKEKGPVPLFLVRIIDVLMMEIAINQKIRERLDAIENNIGTKKPH